MHKDACRIIQQKRQIRNNLNGIRDDTVNYGIFKYWNIMQLLKYLPRVFNRVVKCLWDNVKEGKK